METEFTLQPARPAFSQAHPTSHPARLATVARLFGLEAAPVSHCKVLELGCSQGQNLIPMAQMFPESIFLGIDDSATAVASGIQVIRTLGLKNISLQHRAYGDPISGQGKFGYVIAHGLFSRLSRPMQTQLLSFCAQVLEPSGLIYVSYNVYPGWHGRGMVAEMLRFYLARFNDADERLTRARGFLEFLAKAAVPKESTYRRILQEEEGLARNSPSWTVQQEYLEPVNNPLYFHEFTDCASAARLRYVSDADPATMAPKIFDPETQQTLGRLARDRLQLEQYQDFLTNRLFRNSILCHESRQPNYRLDAPLVLDFSVASSAKPVSSLPNLAPDISETFRDRSGTLVTTTAPIVKAALMVLGQIWPQTLPFRSLLDASLLRMNAKLDTANREQGGTSLALFLLDSVTSSNIVELHLYPPAFASEASLRPTVTPLVRWQAVNGTMVTTQRHESVVLSEAERQTVALLDGTRDRTALVRCLFELVEKGVLTPQRAGQQVDTADEKRLIVEDTLNQILTQLARSALLVA